MFRESPAITLKRWLWRVLVAPIYSIWVKKLYRIELAGRVTWVGGCIWRNLGNIAIGRDATIISAHWGNPLGNYRPCILETSSNGKIIVGNKFSASGCCIIAAERITIGDRVSLGANVTIMDNDLHALLSDGSSLGGMEAAISRPIVIGDDSWIGAGAVILKGVQLGRGVIVGAGVVVRKSVPDGAVITGAENQIRVQVRVTEVRGKPTTH
jgi:acetyltransferase-like isoleucine patch superfamily enzyme